MFSLDLETLQADRDILIAELFDAGSAGINESSAAFLRAFFEDEASARAAALRFGGIVEPADETDWVAEAQNALQPQAVGECFFLVPEWRSEPAPPGRFRLSVNNGLAFGTGRHESTRLCLQLLEEWVKPGSLVLDIGTGSGILAEAALLLGAGSVFACDIDHTASQIAAQRGVAAFTGSTNAIRPGIADLAVANITPETIAALAEDLSALLKPEGVLILSGLELDDDVPFAPRHVLSENNWKALVITEIPGPPAQSERL